MAPSVGYTVVRALDYTLLHGAWLFAEAADGQVLVWRLA